MSTGLSVSCRTARLLAGRLRPLIGWGSSGRRDASDEECSSISSVNGSSFDDRAEAVVVRGCGQAEVRALLTVLHRQVPEVTPEFRGPLSRPLPLHERAGRVGATRARPRHRYLVGSRS